MTDKEDPVESGAASVADVFKDEEPEPVEAKAEPEPEPESKGEPEPTPEPEPKVDEPEEKPEPEAQVETPSTEPESVPRQALLDERRKRQALEAEVKALRQKDPSQDENAPDPIVDPEGYKTYLKGQWETERFTEVTNKSREKMLETHSDYEDMEKHFVMMTRDDPSLIQKMRDHYDPAKFAYEAAKESKGKQYTEIEKQVIEKLRKEGKLKDPKAPPAEVANLINSPGAGKNSDKPVKEITSVKELFN